MLRINFIIWAKSCSVDRETNNLSVFEVIEELQTTKLPARFPESKLIVLFERDPANNPAVFDCSIGLQINNRDFGEQSFRVDFDGKKRNRLLVAIPPVTLEERGHVNFRLIS